MNTPNPTSPTPLSLTLESLVRLKAEKLEEVRASKRRIGEQMQQLFAPLKPQSRENVLTQHINSCLAIFDGLMTGIRIMRKIQRFFRRR